MKVIAPVGSIEKFYSAIKAGADEIYMGLKGFGARRNAINLTVDEYKTALDYAHMKDVRVFLTLNTIMTDKEIEGIAINLGKLYSWGLDAVIVQDFGLVNFIQNNYPKLEIHASTQMTIANHKEANYLKKLGFTRVVLARELSFDEIKMIRAKTDIELEVFVAGALCVSYSGNCYMSSFIGGRSGNRGMCAQPCRKKYFIDKNRKSEFLLSPNDQLYTYEQIQKLKSIGIDSIKIEGRMKDERYVYQTVNLYRNYVDGKKIDEKVSNLFNRGYGTGYFYENFTDMINKKFASHMGKKLGEIKNKKIKLEDNLMCGDGIIYLTKNYEKILGTYVNKIEMKNRVYEKFAKTGDVLILRDVPFGAKYIFKNFCKNTNDMIKKELQKNDRKKIAEFSFFGKVGQKIELTVKTKNTNGKKIKVKLFSEEIVEKSLNKGISKDLIEKKLLELGESDFVGVVENINIDENIFFPFSTLKKLRREAVLKLSNLLVNSYHKKSILELRKLNFKPCSVKKSIISAVVSNMEQKKMVEKLGIKKIYLRGFDVARENILKNIDLNSNLATNLYQLIENKNKKITLGWNLNIFNRYAFNYFEKLRNIDTIILSPEMSYERIKQIGETKIKKAILIYAKPRVMYTKLKIAENLSNISNENEDIYNIKINQIGETEIYLEKPLNIIKDRELLEKLGIEEFVFEFNLETPDEIKEILKGNGIYRPYNYEKGVY